MMNSQKGQALPLAIIALAIGSLVVAPFLGLASADLLGSQVYGESIAAQAACEAGVEHAIWSLTMGDLAGEFAGPGDVVTYQLDEPVNGLTAGVTVTANATGGGYGGDISDAVIDTLEFDKSACREPDILNVAAGIYAVAYCGPGNDGFVKTLYISPDGEIDNDVVDSLEFDGSDGYEPAIIHVSGNVYAVAYRGDDNDGFLKTLSIDPDGDIHPVIDTLEFDTSDGYEPSITRVSGDVYAIAYRGSGSRGYLKTVNIAADGRIGNRPLDTMIFDNSAGYEPSIIYVAGDVYTIVYRGSGNDGFITTLTIDDDGDIGSRTIDTLEFDNRNCYEPDIINISDDIYAITYRGSSNRGYLGTVSIHTSGAIGSVIDSFSFDNSGYEPDIIRVSNDIFAVAYRGSGNDGYVITITIAAGGDIAGSATDTLRFDSSSGYEPSIIMVSSAVFAIVYRGSGNDGFIKTIGISASGGTSAYEITASAGGRTIRAFVNTSNTTAAIVSWQIE